MHNEVIDKITSKQAVIAIVGLGYVGLPLLIRYAEAGFNVIGIDIDQIKVDKLNNGESYIKQIPDSTIQDCLNQSKVFKSTTDFSLIADVNVAIICVPTPLKKNKEPDLSFVINTTESIIPHLQKGQVFSLESTTYPGTTEEEILPRLESNGLKVGKDCFLIYSPEREDPGNKKFNIKNVPKVVSGHTENCLSIGEVLYGSIVDEIVPVSSTKVAEMTKLLENIHRAVNVGLVNELKIVADKMDINIHEVIEAASTKPFGFEPYYPGPGLGGHCIPIDPFYLSWKASQHGVEARFIQLAGEINTNITHWVVNKTEQGLIDVGKSINNSTILILGVAYKKNVEDLRESPGLHLIDLLTKRYAKVQYSDPYVKKLPKTRKHDFKLSSVDLNPENIKGFDVILIAADHDIFDYKMIEKHANLIVDTRGVFQTHNPKIVMA